MVRASLVVGTLVALFTLGSFLHNPPPEGELAPEAYVSLEKDLVAVLDSQGVATALSRLSTLMEADPQVLNSCHFLAHALGRAAFQKWGSVGEALFEQDELCNSGYIHGVIEAAYGASENPIEEIGNACNSYATGTFMHWQCFHGIGHGLMFFSNNDLPSSAELCRDLSEPSRAACLKGVYMENFNVDGKLHVSSYLNPSDPLSICRSAVDARDCYLFAPIYLFDLYEKDYRRTLEACSLEEAPFDSMCATGVGFQTMKRNVQNIDFVETVCSQASQESRRIGCIEGMATFYIFNFAGFSEAASLCENLQVPVHREACRARIDYFSSYLTPTQPQSSRRSIDLL